MSLKVLNRLRARFGEKILVADSFCGDDEATVAPVDWLEVARFVREDPECSMDHFIDLTAVDYPEREPALPRFDVVVMLRSFAKNHRVRLKVRVAENEELDSLTAVWAGADWTEREVYDLFGIRFRGHPDLRRILMYDEFVGYPLRKDYPIDKTQPLIPYRDVGPSKLAPFGGDEGQPYGRIDWFARMQGHNWQVSPAIAVQQGQRSALSVPADDLAQPDDALPSPPPALQPPATSSVKE
jgi:NADH-quinone oxidoreductase subunit C